MRPCRSCLFAVIALVFGGICHGQSSAQSLQVKSFPVGYLLEWSGAGDPASCAYRISLEAHGAAPVERARLLSGDGHQGRFQFLLTELLEPEIVTITLTVFLPDGTPLRQESVAPEPFRQRSLRLVNLSGQEGHALLQLHLESAKPQTLHWILQDLERKTLKRDQETLSSGAQHLTLDFGDLPSGTYHLFLHGEDEQHEVTFRITAKGTVLAGPVD